MSKYSALGQHLDGVTEDIVKLSFGKLEGILGFQLPASARKHKEWWSNTDAPGRHSHSWISRGWHTGGLDLARKQVTFMRVGARTKRAAPPAGRPALKPRAGFHPAMLAPSDFAAGCSVAVNLHWRRLGALALTDSKLLFPAAPQEAGIYRMIVRHSDRTKIYVGEAVNLSRRFGNYRNPGNTQQTSLRINAFLVEVLASKGSVAVDIAYEGVELSVSGKAIAADLTSKPIRRLIEQAAIVAHHGIDVEMLNL